MRRISRRRQISMKLERTEQLESRVLLSGAYRSIDGSGNNEANPHWGQADTQLLRLTTVEYADGISEPSGGFDGSGRPNPRIISNLVVDQETSITNDRSLTGFVFQWGQFLDHDLDLTEEAHPVEVFNVEVSADDTDLIPDSLIPVFRSRFDDATGTNRGNPRQQINQITSYIDGSNVYGSDDSRAVALRTGSGGKLKTSGLNDEFLPYNTVGQPNAAPPPLSVEDYFLAGDIRANEQPGLTSLHTLFVREHNRLADEIAAADTSLDDEEIYQRARQLVGAQIQAITYYEFLPALLGPAGLGAYEGYDSTVDASVANIFSAALYRVGHTMLPSELLRLDSEGDPIVDGSIALGDAFFDPSLITDYGIETYLRGLASQPIQEIDAKVVDGVRNLLFDPPAQFDLAAINMQRGRDHGLPDYNQARLDFGLAPVKSFRGITSDPETRDALAEAYEGDINNVDPWLGGIAEDHLPGSSLGELIQTVLVDQFQRSREGDRFYFENIFSGDELDEILDTRLSDIIRRNSPVVEDIQDEVFRANSVLVYRVPSGTETSSVTILLSTEGDLQVVDTTSGSVLALKPAGEATGVVHFGAQGDDTVIIDASLSGASIPIELHGGSGTDMLVIEGTEQADLILIEGSTITFNGSPSFFGDFESLHAMGRGGIDVMTILEQSPATVILDGGDHADFLTGNDGDEILIGGDGSDLLVGRGGRDLLIGGAGLDLLLGGSGQDMLFAGQTAYDTEPDVLLEILGVWTSAGSYRTRVTDIRRDFFEPSGSSGSSSEDDSLDIVLGGGGRDWFFLGLFDLTDRKRNESNG